MYSNTKSTAHQKLNTPPRPTPQQQTLSLHTLPMVICAIMLLAEHNKSLLTTTPHNPLQPTLLRLRTLPMVLPTQGQ